MELGFETIGNAILICYDREPVLVTDPWTVGDAYFGSWTRSHEIPDQQQDAIGRARFAWISHGHPDHLSPASLRSLRSDVELLLPDHVGGRIAAALVADGYRVTVLPDRKWTPLSDRIRVCSIADYNQDGILLVDVGGRLVVNLNDATDHGWRGFVRSVIRRYDVSFLLQLSGFGDADMINLFDETGHRIPPLAAQRHAIGATLAARAEALGARYVAPFSSMHRYQRTDSAWANDHVADLSDYAEGFDSRSSELLPAFVRYDCLCDEAREIRPPGSKVTPRPPEEFGDSWDEPLEQDDVALARRYFGGIAHLEKHVGVITLRVAGEEHTVLEGTGRNPVGIVFEAPRQSLVTALRHDIFDDLLIGNFMRTTIHGSRDPSALYPHFTPYVGKYADNGGARTPEELRQYLRAYRRRDAFGYLRHRVEQRSVQVIRRRMDENGPVYRQARRAHRAALSGLAGVHRRHRG